jgi:protein TonB
MERPTYLAVSDKFGRGRLGSAAIVAALHVAAIFGLVAALNQGELMKELKVIQAAIDAPDETPREPPPPPPDLVKPTPPVAIVPEFTVRQAVAPTPSITTVPAKPASTAAPAPSAVSPPNDPLRPIMKTHILPPYPPIARRLNEQGTTLMELTIAPQGNASECRIVESSSSERLDEAGCDFVKSHWRWQPPTNAGKPVSARTHVSIKWDLRTSN